MGMIRNSFQLKIVTTIENNKCKRKTTICTFQSSESYKYKLKSFSECETIKKSLNSSTLKSISLKNLEPLWVIKFRLDALKSLYNRDTPKWSEFNDYNLDINNSIYYSALIKKDSAKHGVIFTNLSNSLKNYSDLISNFMGSVVS